MTKEEYQSMTVEQFLRVLKANLDINDPAEHRLAIEFTKEYFSSQRDFTAFTRPVIITYLWGCKRLMVCYSCPDTEPFRECSWALSLD